MAVTLGNAAVVMDAHDVPAVAEVLDSGRSAATISRVSFGIVNLE
jgi:hypothetical protein